MTPMMYTFPKILEISIHSANNEDEETVYISVDLQIDVVEGAHTLKYLNCSNLARYQMAQFNLVIPHSRPTSTLQFSQAFTSYQAC